MALIRTERWVVENDGTLLYYNGAKCGTIYKEVDGYYHWDSGGRRGAWEAFALRDIADMLDNLNADWDNEVRKAQF